MVKKRIRVEKILTRLLICLPSLAITLFYIPNALDNLLDPNQTDKIIENAAVLITAGIFLLIATALFLYQKTSIVSSKLKKIEMMKNNFY